jgi:GNAT superfamily N-acetyltransferase
VAEGLEHYDGIEISMEKEDDEIMVKAMMSGGRELGHVLFVIDGEYLAPQDLEVDERYQGQGIAATMYDYVKSKGYKIRRSGQQTDAGSRFWNKHKPGKNVWEQGVAENFADGKKPGRKGLAKRVGVNCKQSVSKLRSIAKNSSGERQRMAHWCANMKSGKKE